MKRAFAPADASLGDVVFEVLERPRIVYAVAF